MDLRLNRFSRIKLYMNYYLCNLLFIYDLLFMNYFLDLAKLLQERAKERERTGTQQ